MLTKLYSENIKKVWRFSRAKIEDKSAITVLFKRLDAALAASGVRSLWGGQTIEASIVATPKQRKLRARNGRSKPAAMPAEWGKEAD